MIFKRMSLLSDEETEEFKIIFNEPNDLKQKLQNDESLSQIFITISKRFHNLFPKLLLF